MLDPPASACEIRGAITSAAPARRRPRFAAELAGLAVGYLVYELLRAARGNSARIAHAHALEIYRVETALHINVEGWCNHLLMASPLAALAAGYYYATGHFVVTIAVLIWLYVRHPERYRQLRSALVVTTALALAGYWLYPLAPPRLALPGLTDIVVRHDVFGAASPHGPISMINLYAAMPSLHVAWAVWIALAITRTLVHPARHIAWCYPLLTTAVVLGTANHFLIDAVVGAALAVLAQAAVSYQAATPRRPPSLAARSPSHA